MWIRVVVGLVLAVALGVALAMGWGSWRWARDSRAAVAALEARRIAPPASAFDTTTLAGLPAPVARYLQHVIAQGRPLPTSVRLRQEGTIQMGSDSASWRPFAAEHRASLRPPGMVWDARIGMGGGLAALVRDGYGAGQGSMYGALAGVLPLVNAPRTRELAEGALMRWLAEAAWYPTALLPGGAVTWAAVDDSTADATVADDGVSVTLRFRFNGLGEIASVRSEGRSREVAGRMVRTPWGGTFVQYEEFDGIRIPTVGAVSWFPPGEPELPYWRGRITQVEFSGATGR